MEDTHQKKIQQTDILQKISDVNVEQKIPHFQFENHFGRSTDFGILRVTFFK